MSFEGNPQGRTFLSAEQEQQMREDAIRRARAKVAAQNRASAGPAPAPERRRPSAPAAQPVPVSHAPASTQQPIRRTTRSAPMTAEQAASRATGQSLLQPQPERAPVQLLEEVEVQPRKKRTHKGRVISGMVAVGLVGGGYYAYDNDMLDSVNPASVVPNSATQANFGDAIAPAVTGAEGFNMSNCTAEGAEIASLRITTGHYAMRYLLQLGEDPAPRVQPPYVTEGNMGEHQEYVTESGYPEMTVHDIVMQIYACQKDGASAVDSTASGTVINKNNLDFIAKPLLPEGNSSAMQTEAYMSDLEDGVIFTYPRDWLPVVDPANTDALKPVRDVHFTEVQQKGVFNVALQTAVAAASTASESDYFENVDFVGTQGRTLYSAIDQGLKQRLGSENVTLTGAVNSIAAQDAAPDAKATLIDTTGNPADTFKIVEGEVIVGHYASEAEKEEE